MVVTEHSDMQQETEVQEEGKRQTSRPASGIDAPSLLGKVTYSIGEMNVEITQFKTGKNDISIADDIIAIRIVDMNDRALLISLRGPKIYENPIGQYPSVLSGTKEARTAMISSVGTAEDAHWKDGILEVIAFNASTGVFKANLNGKGVEVMKIAEESDRTFQLNIDMRFENVVNLIPKE